jgi:tetratricopeptide (TPR) repeat protein
MLREEKRKRMEGEAAMERVNAIALAERVAGVAFRGSGKEAKRGSEPAPFAGVVHGSVGTSMMSTASRLRFEALPAYTAGNYPDEFEIFQALDTDGSGRISGTELRCSLRWISMEETAVRILSSLYNADTTGIYAAALTFPEFVEALQGCWATRGGGGAGGERQLVVDMKAALRAKPPLKSGFWGDDEVFHEYGTSCAVRKPVLEMELWERAKRLTLGDKRRNEILAELRSVNGRPAGGGRRRKEDDHEFESEHGDNTEDVGGGHLGGVEEEEETHIASGPSIVGSNYLSRYRQDPSKAFGVGGPITRKLNFKRAANLVKVLTRWFEDSQQPPVFSVYLSCGATDTVQEREYLMQWAYPEIRAACAKHGLQFNLVDNRWSLPDEESCYDHRTAAACCNEIQLGRQTGLSVSFLHLGTNRYGWRPPPATMRAEDFTTVLAALNAARTPGDERAAAAEGEAYTFGKGHDDGGSDDEEGGLRFPERRTALETWYRLDTNSAPPEYRLVPTHWLLRPGLRPDDTTGVARHTAQWRVECRRLALEIEMALDYMTAVRIEVAGGDGGEKKAEERHQAAAAATGALRDRGVGQSVADAELNAGLLRAPADVDPTHSALVFQRSLSDLDSGNRAAGLFTDLRPDNSADRGAAYRLDQLRRAVPAAVPAQNVYRYECKWMGEGADRHVGRGQVAAIAAEDVRRTCAEIRQALVDRLEHAVALKPPAVDALGQEMMAQSAYFDRVAKNNCFCRDAYVERVNFYLDQADGVNSALVLYGEPGVGKTSLMAHLASQATVRAASGNDSDGQPPPLVVARFCSITEASSHAASLLRGLCMQLAAYCSSTFAVGGAGGNMGRSRRLSRVDLDNGVNGASNVADVPPAVTTSQPTLNPRSQPTQGSKLALINSAAEAAVAAAAANAAANAAGLSLAINDAARHYDLDFWLRRAAASTGRTILVYIDGLEVLTATEDRDRPFDWIPLVLPPRVRMVISTVVSGKTGAVGAEGRAGGINEKSSALDAQIVPTDVDYGGGDDDGDIGAGDAVVNLLRRRGFSSAAFVSLEPLSVPNRDVISKEWLRLDRRVITPGQFKLVRAAFRESPDAGKGLYLKMVHRLVSQWSSDEDPEFNEPMLGFPRTKDGVANATADGVVMPGATGADAAGAIPAGKEGDKGGDNGGGGRSDDEIDEVAGTVMAVQPLPTLPLHLSEMLNAFFDGLEREHGEVLTSRAFAYLSLSVCGLTRRELGDILTCDDDVLTAVIATQDFALNATHHASGAAVRARASPSWQPGLGMKLETETGAGTGTRTGLRRVPPLVLSRLLADVGDLMHETYSGFGLVLQWQHRDFRTFAAARYVKDSESTKRLCTELVDYFDGTSHYRHPNRGVQSQPLWFVHPIVGGGGVEGDGGGGARTAAHASAAENSPGVPNMRRVLELPTALLRAGNYARLCELLSDLDLFSIMDQSGCSTSVVSGDGSELGHGHSRARLHAIWAEAEVRSKADKKRADKMVERARAENKTPHPTPTSEKPTLTTANSKREDASTNITRKGLVVAAELAAASLVVVDVGECYLRAVRRLQARFASAATRGVPSHPSTLAPQALFVKPGATTTPRMSRSDSITGGRPPRVSTTESFAGRMRAPGRPAAASSARVLDTIVAQVSEGVAAFLAEAGKLDAAISLGDLALTIREDMVSSAAEGCEGEPHVSTSFSIPAQGGQADKQVLASKLDLAGALSTHAGMYRRLGMFHRATPLLRRCHAVLVDVHGSLHPDTVTMLNEIADACIASGRYADALKIYEEFEMSITVRANHVDDGKVSTSPTNYASPTKLAGVAPSGALVLGTGLSGGKGEEAASFTQQAVTQVKAVEGQSRDAVAMDSQSNAAMGVVLSNQGAILVQLGHPKRALHLLQRASALLHRQHVAATAPRLRLGGGDDRARGIGDVTIIGAKSKYKESAAAAAAAAANSRATATSILNNTAAAYLTLGDTARATQLLASPEADALPPPPSSQIGCMALSWQPTSNENPAPDLPSNQKPPALLEAAKSVSFHESGSGRVAVERLQIATRTDAVAAGTQLRPLNELVTLHELSDLPIDMDPRAIRLLAASFGNLAQAQSRAGSHRTALSSARRSVRLLETLTPEPSFGLAAVLNSAAAVLAAAQRPEHALPVYDRCLAVLELVLDDRHPQLQSCVAARAACLAAAGRGVEAAQEMTRALQLAERRWESALKERLNGAASESSKVSGSFRKAQGSTLSRMITEDEDPTDIMGLSSPSTRVDEEDEDGSVAVRHAGAQGGEHPEGTLVFTHEDEDAAAVVLHARQNLARLLHAQGHVAQSLALRESTLDLAEKVHGVGDALVAAYNSLAVAYQLCGMRQEALAVVRRRMALIGRGNDDRFQGAEAPVGHLSPWYHTLLPS